MIGFYKLSCIAITSIIPQDVLAFMLTYFSFFEICYKTMPVSKKFRQASFTALKHIDVRKFSTSIYIWGKRDNDRMKVIRDKLPLSRVLKLKIDGPFRTWDQRRNVPRDPLLNQILGRATSLTSIRMNNILGLDFRSFKNMPRLKFVTALNCDFPEASTRDVARMIPHLGYCSIPRRSGEEENWGTGYGYKIYGSDDCASDSD